MALPVDSGAPAGLGPSFSASIAVASLAPSFAFQAVALTAASTPIYGPGVLMKNVSSPTAPSARVLSSAIGGFAIGLSPIGG